MTGSNSQATGNILVPIPLDSINTEESIARSRRNKSAQCPSVHRPRSIHKVFSDMNEIWYVDRG